MVVARKNVESKLQKCGVWGYRYLYVDWGQPKLFDGPFDSRPDERPDCEQVLGWQQGYERVRNPCLATGEYYWVEYPCRLGIGDAPPPPPTPTPPTPTPPSGEYRCYYAYNKHWSTFTCSKDWECGFGGVCRQYPG